MSVFVDASVLVAILAREPDSQAWLDQLSQTAGLMTSPIAIWEAVRATARILETSTDAAHAQLLVLLNAFGVRTVEIGSMDAVEALRAHQVYGKGNHPAKLNMGDCFTYACARTNNATLLYKGDDFALTDLA